MRSMTTMSANHLRFFYKKKLKILLLSWNENKLWTIATVSIHTITSAFDAITPEFVRAHNL